jgi:heptosyltransferase I
MKRIGIVMLSALGDAVHVLPLLTAIKRQWPDAEITWVTQPGPAALVRGHPALDRLVVFNRERGWAAFPEVRREVGPEPFDVLLDLQVYLKAGILTGLLPARTKLGFDWARAKDFNWLFTTQKIPAAREAPRHVQDQYFEFLTALGVPFEPPVWNLGPWPGDLPPPEGRYAALVIGTSRPEKDWVPERWAAVAEGLYEQHGLVPMLVGGGSARERATATAIVSGARAPVRNELGSGLRPLVSILRGATLVVSLDTGPLHMAVALERPVVSLIGYNDPRVVGPYRRYTDLIVSAYNARVARGKRMHTISAEAVLERCASAL